MVKSYWYCIVSWFSNINVFVDFVNRKSISVSYSFGMKILYHGWHSWLKLILQWKCRDMSNVVGSQNQVCTKCNKIDKIMKPFESREILGWKTNYKDEKKKVKWITLLLIPSMVFFVWYVKMWCNVVVFFLS